MKKFDIYLTGVGGQGIGLLSETIARAANYAGFTIKGTDTHGLAQRGGMVSSHIRLGENINACLIRKNNADMVIGMENHESLRGMTQYLKKEGILVFYNTILQPLPVRLGTHKEITENIILYEAEKVSAKVYKAHKANMDDPRMQNMILLGEICKNELIPGIKMVHFVNALKDILSGDVLIKNLELFKGLVLS